MVEILTRGSERGRLTVASIWAWGALSAKVNQSLLGLCEAAVDATRWKRLAWFHAMLDKQLAQISILGNWSAPGGRKRLIFQGLTRKGLHYIGPEATPGSAPH